ncbi:MAG: TatD family hydrolase [Bacilli bacterium]
MLYDVHNHIDFFSDSEWEIAKKQIEEDNIKTIAVAMDENSYIQSKKRAADTKNISVVFGIHPWCAHAIDFSKREDFVEWIKESEMIGEIGLDFCWAKNIQNYEAQKKWFQWFLERSKQYQKFVNVHTKGAEIEVLHALQRNKIENPLIHWYSGSLLHVPDYLKCGSYFSISADFATSSVTHALIQQVPIDHLLVETDGPTARAWVNGDIGYPVLIKDIISYICKVKELPEELVIEKIANNSKMFYQ